MVSFAAGGSPRPLLAVGFDATRVCPFVEIAFMLLLSKPHPYAARLLRRGRTPFPAWSTSYRGSMLGATVIASFATTSRCGEKSGFEVAEAVRAIVFRSPGQLGEHVACCFCMGAYSRTRPLDGGYRGMFLTEAVRPMAPARGCVGEVPSVLFQTGAEIVALRLGQGWTCTRLRCMRAVSPGRSTRRAAKDVVGSVRPRRGARRTAQDCRHSPVGGLGVVGSVRP